MNVQRPSSSASRARTTVVLYLQLACLVTGLLAGLSGCDNGGRGGLDPLRELERLAFVPVGECPVTPTLVCANEVPLLVDRYEVTRGDWRRWQSAGEDASARAVIDAWGADTHDLPAGYLNLDEARRYAASRGMRLLSAAEWIRVASGTSRQQWPWGYRAISVANTLELGLRKPAAVGTFEQGSTQLGIYDMLGNVWEWVDERIEAPGFGEPARVADDGRGWVMGGSYLTLQRSLLEPYEPVDEIPVYHAELDQRHRAIDIGLRCAAEAETYLVEHAPEWGTDARARERLTAIGASWGQAALPLLDELAARDGAAPGLSWLAEGARQ